MQVDEFLNLLRYTTKKERESEEGEYFDNSESFRILRERIEDYYERQIQKKRTELYDRLKEIEKAIQDTNQKSEMNDLEIEKAIIQDELEELKINERERQKKRIEEYEEQERIP